ncbi:YsnF/AvaK domain-containing protein [Peribacillus butanolivorans]|uniref:YsnF/AvaK domain-containing protein n=1 Tax=Peribacillus butanolivorans TaxID=421767 RepID=UPI0036BFE850
MNKTVYGVYESNAEVIQAINALKAKGFEGDDILVVADKEETLDFTNHQRETDVHTMTNVPNDESFMDKVARFFMPDDTADLSTRLADAGLSNSEAAEHVYDIEQGKVLVLVEEGEGYLGTSRDKFTTGVKGVGTSGTTLDTNSANPLYNGTEKRDPLNKDDVYGVNGRGREDSLETGSINEGETLRIPVVDEKLEGLKIPVVTDEIVIKKHAVQETEQVQDTFKKEDIQLDSTDDSIVHEKKAAERRNERF